MLIASIIIFAVAAVFGLTLLVPILQNKETPKVSVIFHGLFAATGLVLLIIFSINNTISPTVSLVLFIIAALGGFVLVARDFMKKPGPKGLAIIHACAAVIAFILLIIFALG